MREKHAYHIKNKVIKVSDVRSLAKLFNEICRRYLDENYANISEDKRHYSITFSIKTADNAEYSADVLDILNTEGILDTKKPVEVNMTFYDYGKSHISIGLADSQSSYANNGIAVEGDDTTLVNGAFHKLIDCVNS